MENAFYVLQQYAKKAYLSKMILILILGVVFFFGIWLNLNLLRVGDSTKSVILSLVAIFMLLLALIQTFLTYKKTKKNPYYFYNNRIVFRTKQVFFGNIQNVYLERSFFDKIFGTGTIVLHPYMKMKNVTNSENMMNYVKQLVQRAKQYY